MESHKSEIEGNFGKKTFKWKKGTRKEIGEKRGRNLERHKEKEGEEVVI